VLKGSAGGNGIDAIELSIGDVGDCRLGEIGIGGQDLATGDHKGKRERRRVKMASSCWLSEENPVASEALSSTMK
jgi:hypothetical protein